MREPNSEELRGVLDEAYRRGGFAVMSNFAQRNMVYVAMAASLNLITTQAFGEWTRTWRVTSKGLRWLNEDQYTQ